MPKFANVNYSLGVIRKNHPTPAAIKRMKNGDLLYYLRQASSRRGVRSRTSIAIAREWVKRNRALTKLILRGC